jgi:hypothetical protein
MASTEATMQSYNDINVLGQVLQVGAGRRTPFFAAAGGLGGVIRVPAQQFAMSANYSLDAGSQNAIDETASLSAATAKFYAKTQEYNAVQIAKYGFASSHLNEANRTQLSNTNAVYSSDAPQTSEFDRAAANAMAQMVVDWEFTMLQGTRVARSAVTTDVAAGGLLDSTMGAISKVNANSAKLSKALIDELVETIAGYDAPMQEPVIVIPPGYVNDLNDIYGFAEQSRTVGGVNLSQIFLPIIGQASVIWTNQMEANSLLIADLAYIKPAVLPHANGEDILMAEYSDGGSARKGYIEGYIGVDFGSRYYHGFIHGLA